MDNSNLEIELSTIACSKYYRMATGSSVLWLPVAHIIIALTQLKMWVLRSWMLRVGLFVSVLPVGVI
jgi:hypothetical protein